MFTGRMSSRGLADALASTSLVRERLEGRDDEPRIDRAPWSKSH